MLIDLEILKKEFKLNVFNIVHVGANLGQEVETYNKIFPNSHIYLIEPQKNLFKIMNRNFKNNNKVSMFNIALGNTVGDINLNLSPTNLSASSILKPTFHKEIHPEVKFEGSEIVTINKYENLNFENVNFLNIDTQGYELEVLKGVGNNIKFINYILAEINTKELYENSPLVSDIDKFLGNLGFVRVVTVFWNDDCYWGDAFYIRKSLITNPQIYRNKIKNYLFKSVFIYKFVKNLKTFLSNK